MRVTIAQARFLVSAQHEESRSKDVNIQIDTPGVGRIHQFHTLSRAIEHRNCVDASAKVYSQFVWNFLVPGAHCCQGLRP